MTHPPLDFFQGTYDVHIHTRTHTHIHTHSHSHTHTCGRTRIRYVFVAIAHIGFIFFDMVYLSVIITYASQSELIQFYITSIIDRVNTKAYSLEDAMKVSQ